jgi:hypothetical protein
MPENDPRLKKISDLLSDALNGTVEQWSDGSLEIRDTDHAKVVEAAKLLKSVLDGDKSG